MNAKLKSSVVLVLLMLSSVAWSGEKRSLCIYDPIGVSGDIYSMMKEFSLKTLNLGV